MYGHGCKQDDCCGNGGGGGLYVSLEALYLKPRWDNAAAFTQNVTQAFVDLPNGQAGLLVNNTNASSDFNPSGRIASRITAGYGSAEGIGVRLRWFRGSWSDTRSGIDDASLGDGVDIVAGTFVGNTGGNTITTLPALGVGFSSTGTITNPSTVVVVGDLKMDVWDLEGTTSLKFKNVELGFSAGLRYLHASQDYNAVEINPNPALDGNGLLTQPRSQILVSGHNVNVVGPSAGIEGRIPVGGTGLALYSLSRGSLLFGEGHQTAVHAVLPQDATLQQNVAGFPNNGASQFRDTLVPTLEIEFGTEFSREMGNSALFVKSSVVGQLYYNLGNPARVGNIGDPRINSMALWGISLGGGIRY
jgi:hypothetical protein